MGEEAHPGLLKFSRSKEMASRLLYHAKHAVHQSQHQGLLMDTEAEELESICLEDLKHIVNDVNWQDYRQRESKDTNGTPMADISLHEAADTKPDTTDATVAV